jgi:hypothetical protein
VKGDGEQLDFGDRTYDPRLGRFLSVDPLAKNYAEMSNYSYAQNSPTFRIDVDGGWDITVHAYSDRKKYGYGVAIVTDRHGNEVFRFKVRLEGVGGRNRLEENNDTPLGTYDIPDKKDTWLTGKSRKAYGPNARLSLTGVSGEIKESGRDLIRIHGGRQETPIYNDKKEIIGWKPIPDAELQKTHGCLRTHDQDVKTLKETTDRLEANDKLEVGGQLTIVADLQLDKNNEPIAPPVMKPTPPTPNPEKPAPKPTGGATKPAPSNTSSDTQKPSESWWGKVKNFFQNGIIDDKTSKAIVEGLQPHGDY